MSAKTLLLLIAASHAAYVAALVVRAKLGTSQQTEDAIADIINFVSSYLALVWVPVALVVVLVARFVLDPLRLDIELGAMHQDETDDPHQFKGRRMRKVAPLVSVGTYTHRKPLPDLDGWGTKVNGVLEIGWARFGVCVIRHGVPIADESKQTVGASS